MWFYISISRLTYYVRISEREAPYSIGLCRPLLRRSQKLGLIYYSISLINEETNLQKLNKLTVLHSFQAKSFKYSAQIRLLLSPGISQIHQQKYIRMYISMYGRFINPNSIVAQIVDYHICNSKNLKSLLMLYGLKSP